MSLLTVAANFVLLFLLLLYLIRPVNDPHNHFLQVPRVLSTRLRVNTSWPLYGW